MIGERLEREGQSVLLCRGRAGREEPLALLHGFTGAPAAWAEVIQLLPAQGLIAVPSLPGHGLRPDPVPEAFAAAVARLDAALGALHPGPWWLAGYSMGARLALGLLVHNPARVHLAVLVGVNPGLRTEAERQERAVWEQGWAQVLRREGMEAFLAQWEALPTLATQQALPPARRAAVRALRRGHQPAALARALEVLGLAAMPDYWPRLPEVRAPVRLVVGEHDTKFRALGEEAVGRLPNARLHVVPGAGHNVPLEAPEAMAALLR